MERGEEVFIWGAMHANQTLERLLKEPFRNDFGSFAHCIYQWRATSIVQSTAIAPSIHQCLEEFDIPSAGCKMTTISTSSIAG